MSKFTLGQRQFPTLGLRSQQPKNYVGPTLSCYLGHKALKYIFKYTCKMPHTFSMDKPPRHSITHYSTKLFYAI